jgi:octaprenyl-diphosphate synthase
MLAALRQQYAPQLAELDQIMLSELDRWRNKDIERLWSFTEAQLQRHGKQLRPLLALIMTDYLGGEPRVVTPAAASVELYHMASLVLDDVQDHSEIRRGEPALNASVSMSTAVNVALFIRSLSYHLVNRCTDQDSAQRLRIHQELDHAATNLILGQSIDIGWHENWYGSYRDFPYRTMIEGKSGALFGCAAAVGACASTADPGVISAARDYGTAFGVLYQMVDDYLDVFGDETVLRRPRFDDFREGKMTGPVICLLSALQDDGCRKNMDLVLAVLSGRDAAASDWGWLLELMHDHNVARKLRKEISERASRLAEPVIGPGRGSYTGNFAQLVELIATPACRE